MPISIEKIKEVLDLHKTRPVKLTELFPDEIRDGKLILDHLDFYRLGPTLKGIDFSDCVFDHCNFSYLADCALDLKTLDTNNNVEGATNHAWGSDSRIRDWSRLMWSAYPSDLFQYAKLSELAEMERSAVKCNDSFFVMERPTESEYGGRDGTLGWKIHISVHPDDLPKAFDLASPILSRYCNTFKVRDFREKSEEEDHRLDVGAQITAYLQEDGKVYVSPEQVEMMMQEVTTAFKENNIRVGIVPESDAKMTSEFFSLRNDRYVHFFSEKYDDRFGQEEYLPAKYIGKNFNFQNWDNPYEYCLIQQSNTQFDAPQFLHSLLSKAEDMSVEIAVKITLDACLHQYTSINMIDTVEKRDQFIMRCSDPLDDLREFIKPAYHDNNAIIQFVKMAVMLTEWLNHCDSVENLSFQNLTDIYTEQNNFKILFQEIQQTLSEAYPFEDKKKDHSFLNTIKEMRIECAKKKLEGVVDDFKHGIHASASLEETIDKFNIMMEKINPKNPDDISYVTEQLANQYLFSDVGHEILLAIMTETEKFSNPVATFIKALLNYSLGNLAECANNLSEIIVSDNFLLSKKGIDLLESIFKHQDPEMYLTQLNKVAANGSFIAQVMLFTDCMSSGDAINAKHWAKKIKANITPQELIDESADELKETYEQVDLVLAQELTDEQAPKNPVSDKDESFSETVAQSAERTSSSTFLFRLADDRSQQDSHSTAPEKHDALLYTSVAGPIKHIYIIGHEVSHEKMFAMAESKGVPCAFIFLPKLNSGENPLDSYREILKKISNEKKLSPHVQITIDAHGNVGQSQKLSGDAHFIGATPELHIDTVELLNVTANTLHLNAENSTTHIYSCHGGRVVQDLMVYKPELEIGVVTHTTDDLVSFGLFDNEGMSNGLQRHNDTEITGEMRTLYDFVSDSITGNDVATSYYLSHGTKYMHGTVRPHQHFLSHPKDYLMLAINNAFDGIPASDKEFLLQQLNIQKMLDDMPSDWMEHYRTAGLLLAAAHGDIEYINAYANAGYDIQATFNRTSAFDLAISKNKPDVVRCLLKKGFDPSPSDEIKTPLFEALFKRHFEIAIILLSDPRVDPNCANKDENTVLHLFSAQNDQIDSVQILLNDARTDPNLKNKSGDTALHIAVRNGQIEIARALLSNERTDPIVLTSSGASIVQIAMQASNPAMVDLLLTHGAEPLSCNTLKRNIRTSSGLTNADTPIQEILKYIGENKININDDVLIFSRAWLIAARHETEASLAEMQELLDAGLNPNIVDERGQSYLHHAAREGNIRMVNILLNHGANPNISDVNGYKPLHCAAKEGHAEITAALLLDKRTDANAKTKIQYRGSDNTEQHYNAIDLVAQNLNRDSESNGNKFGVTLNLLVADGRAEYSDLAKRSVEMIKHMEQSSARTSTSPFLFRLPDDKQALGSRPDPAGQDSAMDHMIKK